MGYASSHTDYEFEETSSDAKGCVNVLFGALLIVPLKAAEFVDALRSYSSTKKIKQTKENKLELKIK